MVENASASRPGESADCELIARCIRVLSLPPSLPPLSLSPFYIHSPLAGVQTHAENVAEIRAQQVPAGANFSRSFAGILAVQFRQRRNGERGTIRRTPSKRLARVFQSKSIVRLPSARYPNDTTRGARASPALRRFPMINRLRGYHVSSCHRVGTGYRTLADFFRPENPCPFFFPRRGTRSPTCL